MNKDLGPKFDAEKEPLGYPYKWCERCEGTGLMKIVHLDGDNNATGHHLMYCPDGCKEPSSENVMELLAASRAAFEEMDHAFPANSLSNETKYRLEKALERFML
jgi:hypothetical protein